MKDGCVDPIGIRFVKLKDGFRIPVEYFESEDKLFNFLLSRAITRNHMEKMLETNNSVRISKVIFSGPATIVFWRDGEKTVVKCMEGDQMNYEMGIAMCTLKKLFGSSYTDFKKHIHDLIPEQKTETKDDEHV